jgi:hypothetical protein
VIDMAKDAFATELTAACEMFRKQRNDDDGGRDGVVLALRALVRFAMATRPDLNDQIEPLISLDSSLRNLEAGKANRLLQRTKRNGRPPASLELQCLQQQSAAAVEILMEGGLKEKDAEICVQTKLAKFGAAYSSETVGNWRSKVLEHLAYRAQSPDKVDMYLDLLGAWNETKDAYRGHLYDVKTKKPRCADTWVDTFIFNEQFHLFIG